MCVRVCVRACVRARACKTFSIGRNFGIESERTFIFHMTVYSLWYGLIFCTKVKVICQGQISRSHFSKNWLFISASQTKLVFTQLPHNNDF